jgi:transcriptional regulator with XRE-family HTH domain
MAIVLSPERLRMEMARRCWSGSELARASGLSAPTVSAALGGRPIAPRTLRLIAQALARAPVVDGADRLIA